MIHHLNFNAIWVFRYLIIYCFEELYLFGFNISSEIRSLYFVLSPLDVLLLILLNYDGSGKNLIIFINAIGSSKVLK